MTASSAGGGTGQVVSAGSAGGSIYDLGYRNYTGPRLGRRHAVASLIRQSFRLAYGLGRPGRAKIVPIGLAGLAAIPAIVGLGINVFVGQVGGGLEEASPIQFATYYSLVAQVVALFIAAQAPELLGRDLRYRVLVLYFTRALRRDDYALAKLAALVLAILVLLLLPAARPVPRPRARQLRHPGGPRRPAALAAAGRRPVAARGDAHGLDRPRHRVLHAAPRVRDGRDHRGPHRAADRRRDGVADRGR